MKFQTIARPIVSLLLFLSLTTLITQYAQAANDKTHFPAIFVGYTDSPDSFDFTYGVEYEYKFNKHWGAGFVYEKINNAHHGDGITVSVIELFYHPLDNVRLGAGIGKEKIGGAHPHSEDLARVSAAYEIHVGDFGIEPTFALDFVGSHKSYVIGLAFVRPF